MTMRMQSPIPARVSQVLQDFLAAELTMIDTEEGEFSTPAIAAGAMHLYKRRPIPAFPALWIVPGTSRIIDTKPDLFGQRVTAEHRIGLFVHVQIADAGENALKLQKLVNRYLTGMFRVLCIIKEGLQTSADPTRWAEIVEIASDIDPGPEDVQASGEIVRTGTFDVTVRKTEVRA